MKIFNLARYRSLLAMLIATFGLSGVFAMDTTPILVFDRVDSDWIITKKFRINYGLHISGSGQFSAKELALLLEAVPTERSRVWIVDLRQESHGFINGLPISWTGNKNSVNDGKSPAQILRNEEALLAQLRQQREVEVFEVKKLAEGGVVGENPVKLPVKLVQSEQQLVHSLKAKYKRLYVLDHNKPDDLTVDNFVDFVKHDIRAGDWLHFHCRGGKGRSSTFIAMYDIIVNAHDTAFDEIIRRQAEMGNISLNAIPDKPEKLWKQGSSAERYMFLKQFYAYVLDAKGYAYQPWSSWLSKNPTP